MHVRRVSLSVPSRALRPAGLRRQHVAVPRADGVCARRADARSALRCACCSLHPAMSRTSKSAQALPAFPVPERHEPAVDDIMGPLARLNLAQGGHGPGFVGGFSRPPPSVTSSSAGSGPGRDKPLPAPPPPMPMPLPTSYSAGNLVPMPPVPVPPRMFFPPPPQPSPVEVLLQQPFPADWPKPLAHSAPSTVATTPAPKTPQRRRSSSSGTASGLAVPSSGPARATSAPPAAPASDVSQCSGVTKQGKRCGNKVKASLPLTYIDGAPEELERYCHVHLKESLAPTGFYSRKQKSVWVAFDDYIMEWLSPDTKAALRAEMVKPASKSDADGYIYTFELRQPARSSDVHLKVGRTNNVSRRLHEWGKQCGKEVVPRGLWPAPEGDGASMLIGRIRPGPAGPFVNRLERLIHLELADLAVMAPYLPEDQRPKLPMRPQTRRSSSDETGAKKSTASPSRPARPYVPCACGSLHKEIFVLPRAKSGKYKDHIWEDLVKSVIERWGNFVNDHVDLAQS